MLERVVKNEKLIVLPVVSLVSDGEVDIFASNIVDVVQNPQCYPQRTEVFASRLLFVENRDTDGSNVFEWLVVLGHANRRIHVFAVPFEEDHAPFFLGHFGFKQANQIAFFGGDDQQLDLRLIVGGKILHSIDATITIRQAKEVHQEIEG